MKPLAIGRRMALWFFPAAADSHSAAEEIRMAADGLRARRGVTLIELMVALAITMIMMTAVITLFANVTTTVSNSRALIEISERLRSARNRLQLDLAGHTATTIPPLRPEDGQGYLEIIEGLNTDASASNTTLGQNPSPPPTMQLSTSTNNILGDTDDILMLTVRSQGEPFVGSMYNGTTTTMIESNTAEVVWFALPNGRVLPADPASTTTTLGATSIVSVPGSGVQLYTLYRRVLLVNPTYFNAAFGASTSTVPVALQANYDLSVFPVYTAASPLVPTGSMPNTLSTLTARENRYYHQPITTSGIATGFPFQVNTASVPLSNSVFSNIPSSTRIGEDVVLTDVLSFDIRVFDPLAITKVWLDGVTELGPSDPGYANAGAGQGPGAFVDLGYNYALGLVGLAANSYFSAYPSSAANASGGNPTLSKLAKLLPPTYDTWSWGYEQNGVDEDNSGTPDQGVNGLDDDPSGTPNGVVDDPPQVSFNYPPGAPPTVSLASTGERETLAPYPFPLRGVQITIRVYEPDTQQIREMTVVQDFLPD